MGWCKKDLSPLLTRWSYVCLALIHRIIITACVIFYFYDSVGCTPPSKSLASLEAQAACQSIDTHFGILTAHDNHKLGLICHHKLIDVHELCIWCKSQGQYVAIYFTGALFKMTENNCKFNENRHFTQLAMGFYEWLEYETFFLQLEFRWWTCKNSIDWHVSYNNMT